MQIQFRGLSMIISDPDILTELEYNYNVGGERASPLLETLAYANS